MKTFVAKPRTVEAQQFDSELAAAVIEWTKTPVSDRESSPVPGGVTYVEGAGFTIDLPGREPERVRIGDYLVMGDDGHVRCVPAVEFEELWHEDMAGITSVEAPDLPDVAMPPGRVEVMHSSINSVMRGAVDAEAEPPKPAPTAMRQPIGTAEHAPTKFAAKPRKDKQ